MRIALLPDGDSANTAYRSIGPMTALERRGHELRQLDRLEERELRAALEWCDVLHVHRVCGPGVVRFARVAKAAGAAVVWDDDDDIARPPRGLTGNLVTTGRKAAEHLAARMKLFETVDLVTTTNPVLGDVFLGDGAPEVRVIENYVIDGFVRDRLPRRGMHVGWVACLEHRMALERLPIVSTLEALLDRHPDLRVTTLGIKLDLRSDRYEHVPGVPIVKMLQHASSFGIGIAPLASDIAINHARSNIKLKEYAAVGVPWLASPIGPYAGLGEKQGGRLVPDDGWYDALDALLRNDRARRKLAKRATRWGDEQRLERNVTRWEQALEHVVARSPRASLGVA
jgi:glycosyltransferase involved in cell wall biosynthesis